MRTYTLEISIDDKLSIVDDLAIYLRKHKQAGTIYRDKKEGFFDMLFLGKDYKIIDNEKSNIQKIKDELQDIVYNIRGGSYDSTGDIASDVEGILYIPHSNG